MKKTALLLLIICAFGCKKENNQREDITTSCRSYTDDLYWAGSPGTHNITETTLSYDANNRLTVVESVGYYARKSVYEYPAENVFSVKFYSNGSVNQHEAYFLNAKNLIDSGVGMVTNNELDTVLFYKYIYNGSDKLIKVLRTYKENNQILTAPPYLYEYDAKGNQTVADFQGTRYENTYYPDLKNNIPIPTQYGYSSPNLLKDQIMRLTDTTLRYRHTYSFDSNGRMATDTTFLENMDGWGVRVYHY